MTRLITILRRARSLLWTAFSIVVILAAVLVGVGQLLMPYSARYQPQLEAWLSQEFGQPVVLESFGGEWAAFGPRLSLQGMQLLPENASPQDAAPEVAIESAALDIKPLNFFIPGLPLYNFRVIGANFELIRSRDGEYRLSGFGVSRRGEEIQVAILDAKYATQKVLEIVLLGESSQLRGVLQTHVDHPLDTVPLQQTKELLGGFLGVSQSVDLHVH